MPNGKGMSLYKRACPSDNEQMFPRIQSSSLQLYNKMGQNKINSHKSRALSTIDVFSNCILKLYSQTLLSNYTLESIRALKLYSQTVLSNCTP